MKARRNQAQAHLDKVKRDLAAVGQQHGHSLVWSAQERAIIDLICDEIDRKIELLEAYEQADDVKVKVRLSAEARLLEQSAARLLLRIRTDVPGRSRSGRWRLGGRCGLGGTAMPRVEQPAGWVLPGIYEKHVPFKPSGKRPDPRLWLECSESAEGLARFEALNAEADAEDAVSRAAAIDRGEPFTIPARYIGGNSFSLPRDHPLRARDVERVLVFANDHVVPVYD